jgi:hypothetical protein
MDAPVRYCVEIADPRRNPRCRLQEAVAALCRVGSTSLDEDVLCRLTRLQRDGALTFGAWVGGRHAADADEDKLYVEIPLEGAAAAHQWSEALVGPFALPSGQEARIRMIGYDVHAQRIEFYYRVQGLLPTALAVLLRRAGMPSREKDVIDLLDRVYRFPLAGRLPSRDVGFSYSARSDGGDSVFSLYFFCLALFGGDGCARTAILALASEHGWDLSSYATLSAPLAAAKGTPTRHGMFGVIVRPERALGITVGLSPPGDSLGADEAS